MFGNRNDLVTKNLLHQHKAVFLTQIVKNNDLKPPNPLYNLIFLMSFASQLYVLVYNSYVFLHYYIIRMSLVCIPMSSACHLYALLCHSYVTRMYSYVIRVSLVCTRMSFICHSYVLVCHLYVTLYVLVCHPCVTRMWFYHKPNISEGNDFENNWIWRINYFSNRCWKFLANHQKFDHNVKWYVIQYQLSVIHNMEL